MIDGLCNKFFNRVVAWRLLLPGECRPLSNIWPRFMVYSYSKNILYGGVQPIFLATSKKKDLPPAYSFDKVVRIMIA